MKGISAVLATVLIVVITVAIIGLAYGWAIGLFGTISSESQGSTKNIVSNMQKSVQITSASCDVSGNLHFTIKNSGTTKILRAELSAYYNEAKLGAVFTDLEAGAASDTINAMSPARTGTPLKLKVDAPAGAVSTDVICSAPIAP